MDKSNIGAIYKLQTVDDTLSTAGKPTEAQLAAIAHEGYQIVINLAQHNDPRYSLKDERGLVESLGMLYIHIPVDFQNPQETDLVAFIEAMEKHLGKKIFLHCAANIRVSAFLGLYNAIKKKEPLGKAFELMDSIWKPTPVWASFISAMLKKYGGSQIV